MAFKFPLDAKILGLPIAYACGAFVLMCARIPTVDPETSNLEYYDDEKASTKQATKYDSQFKSIFTDRIAENKLTVFYWRNRPSDAKQ